MVDCEATVLMQPCLVELADGVLLREQSLEVLCGFQRLSPDILSASGFDLTKLLPSVTTSDDLPENLLLVLNLLSGAPVGTLKWHHPVSCCVVVKYISLCVYAVYMCCIRKLFISKDPRPKWCWPFTSIFNFAVKSTEFLAVVTELQFVKILISLVI